MSMICTHCGQKLDPSGNWESNNHPEIQVKHSIERCFLNVKRQRNETYKRYKLVSEYNSNNESLLIRQTIKLNELTEENNRLLNSLTVMRNLLNRFYGIVTSRQGDLPRILGIVFDVLNGDILSKEEFEDIINYRPSEYNGEKDGQA